MPGPSDDSSNSCKNCSCAAVSITAISSTADYEQTGFLERHENDLNNNMTPSLTTSLA